MLFNRTHHKSSNSTDRRSFQNIEMYWMHRWLGRWWKWSCICHPAAWQPIQVRQALEILLVSVPETTHTHNIYHVCPCSEPHEGKSHAWGTTAIVRIASIAVSLNLSQHVFLVSVPQADCPCRWSHLDRSRFNPEVPPERRERSWDLSEFNMLHAVKDRWR